jgi:bis(5'-nucleosyl)-tetraphosphatase (symmetrical)
MSTYAIGDIQGCFKELEVLLKKINFNSSKDCLWLAGDLVNRGEHSLEVLRFVKSLGNQTKIVLGNHDFHLLAVANEHQKIRHNDTFQDVLNAPDRESLLDWLRKQHLFYYDKNLNFCMTHAGLPPQWNLQTAQQCANEVEHILQSDQYQELLKNIYGNEPPLWNANLTGWDRYRFIVNAFTRMRYIDENGALNFSSKGAVGTQPSDLTPWFKVHNRQNKDLRIIFGHWAALIGKTDEPNIFATDTGCSWGYQLTALRLEDLQTFSVNKF